MGEFSKFKIITVLFLCIFIVFVGVMYTSTKEIVENQDNEIKAENTENAKQEAKEAAQQEEANNEAIANLYSKIDDISGRINDLENGKRLRCSFKGVVGENGIEPLSAEETIEQARQGGNEIVLVCSF